MEDEEEHPIRSPTASYGWVSQNPALSWWKVHTRMRWQPSVCPAGGCTSLRWHWSRSAETRNTVRHQIFSDMRLVVFRKFCYAEYESGDQTDLSHQDFKKIEIKCAKKGDFGHIHYVILVKVIFFLNYNDASL